MKTSVSCTRVLLVTAAAVTQLAFLTHGLAHAQGTLTVGQQSSSSMEAHGSACVHGTASSDLDINNVRARLYNTGSLFQGGRYEIPKDSQSTALFAASLWIGGFVGGELRMAVATYNDWEFWPGPLDASGQPPADCSPFDRMFRIGSDDIEEFQQSGFITADMRDWPWALGAPVHDGDGDPENYNLGGGDLPAILGDQSIWWIMNDAGNLHQTTGTTAIGLEARVLAFAFADARSEAIRNATFYKYTLAHKGQEMLTNAYVGLWADPDLGDPSDDFVGSDSVLQMGFAYNADDFDGGFSGYGDRPPAVGVILLQAPLVDNDGVDNDWDGEVDEEGEELRAGRFLSYDNDTTATGNPVGGPDHMSYLRGRWRDGEEVTFGGRGRGFSGSPANFMYPDPPPLFWSEDNTDGTGTRNAPGDRRFLLSLGPFTLRPGESKDLLFAIVWAQADDRIDSVRQLKLDGYFAKRFFELGFSEPGAFPISSAPEPYAPANGATGQPRNLTFHWASVQGAYGYHWQASPSADFLSGTIDEYTTLPSLSFSQAPLEAEGTLYWRVRGMNWSFGPWSDVWSFALSSDMLSGGGSAVVFIDGKAAFVEVVGPAGIDPCGPNTTSTFGCDQVGGNIVYESFNSTGEYIMYHQGAGPEETLGGFAPHDYEIRFTAEGGYAVYPFNEDEVYNHVWVPFEIWDIAVTYTGTPVNPNNPTDDVRMIPILFGDAEPGDGRFAYGEMTSVFGLGIGATDRVYAYYAVSSSTYTEWEALVKPNVDAAPNGVWNDPSGTQWDLIDFDRGRPIQRIIFDDATGNLESLYPPEGVVIRFLTEASAPPSAPAPSAPADESTVSLPVTLWWTGPPGATSYRSQVASAFGIEVDTVVTGPFVELTKLSDQNSYSWRVQATNENGTSDWSATWEFTTDVGVSILEDGLPKDFDLSQNYPNPFNPATTIEFALPKPERVRLEVFDMLGRHVATLVDDLKPPGYHRATWNADRVASGLYFYRLTSDSYQKVRSMLLVK